MGPLVISGKDLVTAAVGAACVTQHARREAVDVCRDSVDKRVDIDDRPNLQQVLECGVERICGVGCTSAVIRQCLMG